MWLRCCRCDRTTLCLEPVAPSPYLCGQCRETHPDWRPRVSRAMIEDAGRVATIGVVDVTRGEVVIDVTPR